MERRRPSDGEGLLARFRIRYNASCVETRPVKPQDLHATVLHAPGIDPDRLICNHHELEETPLGVEGGAPVYEAFST